MFDDVIIPTCGTFEDHMRDVGLVLDKLITAGFAVKCEKVHIGMTSVPYLGFDVGRDGTTPRPEKTKAILDMIYEDMRAGGATAAARYAGMIGFYHRFVPHLHSVLAPFHACKAKNAPVFELMNSLQMRAAFEFSKHSLATVTALARPDYDKPFYIDVDAASSSGAGAVLSQRDDENDPDSHRPLAFWSRRFSDEERRYGVRDQECLGLAEAVNNWRHMILGARVIVRTDHRSLQWLMSTMHKPGTRASGWTLKLQGYDMEIQYVPGSQHLVADFVSRQPGSSTVPVPSETTLRNSIEDRVYDALDTATEYRDAQSTKRRAAAGLPPLAEAHVADADVQTTTTANVDAQATGASGEGNLGLTDTIFDIFEALCTGTTEASAPTVDTAAASTDNSTPPPSTPTTKGSALASQAAVVFLKRAEDDALEVLVEQQDNCVSLPSVDLTHLPLEHADVENLHKPRPLTYRAQLAARLVRTYTDPTLATQLAARSTVACKRRNVHSVATHFFVGDGNALHSLPSPRFIGTTKFVRIDAALLAQLERDEARFLSKLDVLNLSLNPSRETTPWGADGTKVRKAIENLLRPPATAFTAQADATTLPSLEDAPDGPAFINAPHDFAIASKRLSDRLDKHPSLSMAVDLEGHQLGAHGKTSLIQIAVDANAPDEQQLVYVFDMLACDACLRDSSSDLRMILESPSILKVFHCCYGDAAALFYEYGVVLQYILDTGIADCVARAQHPQKARRLDRVLTYWLGDAVILTFKGQVQHEPGLWLIRPVTEQLFVYAYEDVTYCNLLATSLRTTLQSQGLWDLVLTLSLQRTPPRGLPPAHALYSPPVTGAVALMDASGRVLCRRQGGSLSLPAGPLGALNAKEEARRIWRELMGEPPKALSLRCAINSRMRKGVLIGDTLLFVSYVKDLLESLPLLESALHDGSFGLCTRPAFCEGGPSAGCSAGQTALFQYLHAIAACTTPPPPVLVPTFDDNTPSVLHVAAPCVVSSDGYIKVPLHILTRPNSNGLAAANAATTTQPLRVAVIVHDDTTVYTLTTPSGGNAFPSAAIEEGTSEADTAAKAFDLFAGCSLRKRPPPSTGGPDLQTMPRTSALINAAFNQLTRLGVHGNVVYLACRLPTPDFLHTYAASFYAARRSPAGFQLTAQVLKKFPGFELASRTALVNGTVQGALRGVAPNRLNAYDRAALQGL